MTAVSFTVNRGNVTDLKNSQITVGSLAPGSEDIELRWNLEDANSHNITREDVILACKAFIIALETGGANVDFTNAMGGAVVGFGSPPPV
jgi:hypothetical protein